MPDTVVQLLHIKNLTKDSLLSGHFIKLETNIKRNQKQKHNAPS